MNMLKAAMFSWDVLNLVGMYVISLSLAALKLNWSGSSFSMFILSRVKYGWQG